jgi:hypothetical protein
MWGQFTFELDTAPLRGIAYAAPPLTITSSSTITIVDPEHATSSHAARVGVEPKSTALGG